MLGACSIFFFFTVLQICSSQNTQTQIQLSDMSFNMNESFHQVFNRSDETGDYHIDITLSFYTAKNYGFSQDFISMDVKGNMYGFNNSTNATTLLLDNPADAIIVTATAHLTVLTEPVSIIKTALLVLRDKSSWNGTNQGSIDTMFTGTLWRITASFSQECTNAVVYGFNCDNECVLPVPSDHCYTCTVFSGKKCCASPDIDPVTCKNTTVDHTTTTTLPPQSPLEQRACDRSTEDLYLWIMIGLAALCLLLTFIAIVACIAAFHYHNVKMSSRPRGPPPPFDEVVGRIATPRAVLYGEPDSSAEFGSPLSTPVSPAATLATTPRPMPRRSARV